MLNPEFFTNYVADRSRDSPINIAMMRIILGFYILWRGISMEIKAVTDWPAVPNPEFLFLYPPEKFEWVLIAEKWSMLFFAVSFMIGYRTRLSAFILAVLSTHLVGVLNLISQGGETEQIQIAIFFVLFFGLYSEQDRLSIDTVRYTQSIDVQEANNNLEKSRTSDFSMSALTISQLIIGILYFSSPFARYFDPGWKSWTSLDNFSRFLLFSGEQIKIPVTDLIISNPTIMQLCAWGALLLEASLLIFLILRLPITPIIFGLMTMHLVIYFTIDLLFFDMFFILMVFAAYDNMHSYTSLNRNLHILYNPKNERLMSALYLFKFLDVDDSITFCSHLDDSNRLQKKDNNVGNYDLYLVSDNVEYKNYNAFRQILKQFGITRVLEWFMRFSPIKHVGKRTWRMLFDTTVFK